SAKGLLSHSDVKTEQSLDREIIPQMRENGAGGWLGLSETCLPSRKTGKGDEGKGLGYSGGVSKGRNVAVGTGGVLRADSVSELASEIFNFIKYVKHDIFLLAFEKFCKLMNHSYSQAKIKIRLEIRAEYQRLQCDYQRHFHLHNYRIGLLLNCIWRLWPDYHQENSKQDHWQRFEEYFAHLLKKLFDFLKEYQSILFLMNLRKYHIYGGLK
ncbi:hypothetical protein ACFLUV_04070, partial [Elusimicrobiota bacterium]